MVICWNCRGSRFRSCCSFNLARYSATDIAKYKEKSIELVLFNLNVLISNTPPPKPLLADVRAGLLGMGLAYTSRGGDFGDEFIFV